MLFTSRWLLRRWLLAPEVTRYLHNADYERYTPPFFFIAEQLSHTMMQIIIHNDARGIIAEVSDFTPWQSSPRKPRDGKQQKYNLPQTHTEGIIAEVSDFTLWQSAP